MKKYIYLIAVFSFLTCSFSFYSSKSPESIMSLRLIHIAGESPKVFTEGWVFGAEGILFPGSESSYDISKNIRWSGTGKFYPEYGPETRPVFDHPGINTINIECEYNGIKLHKSFVVYAVMPDYYACVGDFVFCHACSHGCPGCPHEVVGTIGNGSSTVKVRGKSAARVGDGGMHIETCCGSNVFSIAEGDNELLIDGKPAAKIGSTTQHCGGVGIITGENVNRKISSGETGKKFDINNTYGIKNEKEESKPNVFYPAERIPSSVLSKLIRPPATFQADNVIKSSGPDYESAYRELFNNVNDILGFQGGALTLMEELGEMECVKNINEAFGKLGVFFSVLQVISNIYDGKNTEAVGNTLKGGSYWAIGAYGWSALKVASVGIFLFDYTINKFATEMLDFRFENYKKAYYKYYSDDSQVKRDHKKWFSIVEQIHSDAISNNQDYQSRLEDEIGTYQSKFWNPEVSSFYLKEGGLNAELSQEDKKAIMDDYRKNIINPILNAVNVGLMQREKKKVDADIAKQVEELTKLFNTKFPFHVKISGPADKIKKIKIKIGEWSGLTDAKGEWNFDATLYGYVKNNTPKEAVIYITDSYAKKVKFELKEKGITNIFYTIEAPPSIELTYKLDKNTEGANCDLNALAKIPDLDYFWESGEYLATTVPKIAWDWKINGAPLSYFECEHTFTSNSQITTFDKAGDYTIEVSLINLTRDHPDYGKAITTEKKTIKIGKEKEKKVVTSEPQEKQQENNNSGDLGFQAREYSMYFEGGFGTDIVAENKLLQFYIPYVRNRVEPLVNIQGNSFKINYTNSQSDPATNESLTGTGIISKNNNVISCEVKVTYKCTVKFSDGAKSTNATMNFKGIYDDIVQRFTLELVNGTVTQNTPEFGVQTSMIKTAKLSLL
ncbi:MAG: PAAR domain-containing protein [Ignavibacteria bacterium]|nr:PAAR domain-containing protein [Ignavibacteria bacterium]